MRKRNNFSFLKFDSFSLSKFKGKAETENTTTPGPGLPSRVHVCCGLMDFISGQTRDCTWKDGSTCNTFPSPGKIVQIYLYFSFSKPPLNHHQLIMFNSKHYILSFITLLILDVAT
jgi:hypothetical protein